MEESILRVTNLCLNLRQVLKSGTDAQCLEVIVSLVIFSSGPSLSNQLQEFWKNRENFDPVVVKGSPPYFLVQIENLRV